MRSSNIHTCVFKIHHTHFEDQNALFHLQIRKPRFISLNEARQWTALRRTMSDNQDAEAGNQEADPEMEYLQQLVYELTLINFIKHVYECFRIL